MDILFNDDFLPRIISGGTTNGRIVVTKQPQKLQCLDRRERETFEDDIHCVRKKVENSIKNTSNHDAASNDIVHDDEVYTKYKFEKRSKSAAKLPVWSSKSEILQKITENPSVVIEGCTGCGKSTQVSFEEIRQVITRLCTKYKQYNEN